MANKAKRAVKLFGTEVPDSKGRELQVGALVVILDNGALRYIKLNDVEVLRAIAFLVRDQNWGTYTPQIENLKIKRTSARLVVSYDARCSDAKQKLAYHAEISCSKEGAISFDVVATPDADFRTNRTGFVVLHPLKGIAGFPVEVEEVGGRKFKSKFPALVDPVQPFFNIRSLRHQVLPGVFATCRMEGDAFEMEDHRNWTDSSFKTYVRPLALPWPYVLPKGKTLRQSVTLELSGKVPKPRSSGSKRPVEIELGRLAGRLPQLGVAVSSADASSALAHAEVLKNTGAKHLLCSVDGRSAGFAAALETFHRLSIATGAEFRLEIVIAGEGSPTFELDPIARAVKATGLKPAAVLVSPASDLKAILPGSKGGNGPSQEEIIRAARSAFPDAAVGGGMLTFFTELNRKRPPVELIDFITHSTCPLVHAADDISVMETLEALPYVIRSTRAFGGGVPYHMGPSSIPARINPYGAGTAPNPSNGRICLSAVDPRHRGLFGAAWTLGYLSALAAGNLEAVTVGAATGTTGIIHVPGNFEQPYFSGLKGTAVYPLFHIIAGLAPASGSRRIEVRVSEQSLIAALAYGTEQGPILWLGNLTSATRKVKIEGFPGTATTALLDEKSFESAARDPSFHRKAGRKLKVRSLELGPYAVARIATA